MLILIQRISSTFLNDSYSQANQTFPSCQFFCIWRTHKIHCHCKFQANNTALLTTVTTVCISCLCGIFIYLTTALDSLTDISLLPPSPLYLWKQQFYSQLLWIQISAVLLKSMYTNCFTQNKTFFYDCLTNV